MDLKREIRWRPAFDKRDPDPKKNYGIHGVEMKWLLTGPEGVIQFVVYTNWMLKSVRDEKKLCGEYCLNAPMPADIGYHSLTPKYESQKAMGPCEYLDGKDCYYDGSSLNAEKGLDLLCEKGEEAVWEWMEEWYEQHLAAEKEEVA